jgi:Carboxypeptidase regulatory-like domain/TonB-dependent Receptor Plug Domain
MKAFIRLTPAIILFVFLTLSAAAQTIDTAILGTITDSSGAVVPGATVTVLSSATGVTKVASTNAAGEFEVRYLAPGTYDVSVQANGFSSQTQKGIVVQISQQEKLSFSLSVSTRQENVVVQAGQQLLQTEDASLGEVVGPERTENLPLNGRKFDDLAILTPGVAVYNPDLHSSSTDGSAISANGGRVTWGQVNIDGITMVNNRHNYVNLYPSIDAIQEFKVQTGNYAAQYGGNAGSNVNIQIKSGTNEFHGDVFEFIRNDAVDARNYFIPAPIPKNVLKQNQTTSPGPRESMPLPWAPTFAISKETPRPIIGPSARSASPEISPEIPLPTSSSAIRKPHLRPKVCPLPRRASGAQRNMSRTTGKCDRT